MSSVRIRIKNEKKEDQTMNEKFLEVLKHEGPVTIVTINGNPAHVVNTWMSYVSRKDDELYIPAAGMHSIEGDFAKDNHVLLTLVPRKLKEQLDPAPVSMCLVLADLSIKARRLQPRRKSFPG
ncbi:FMN-binding protein [Lacticaseibacillus rhamnosus]|nr:FMN-binding protein [Lacticaseibacillus rhamnosus]